MGPTVMRADNDCEVFTLPSDSECLATLWFYFTKSERMSDPGMYEGADLVAVSHYTTRNTPLSECDDALAD